MENNNEFKVVEVKKEEEFTLRNILLSAASLAFFYFSCEYIYNLTPAIY